MPLYGDGLTYADAAAYGSWPVPARSPAEVWQGFPPWWTAPPDPLRDGIGAGLRRLWLDVASVGARAAVAHLRAHGKGWHLDLVAQGVGLVRAEGERDVELRARIATVDDALTAPALQAAYDAATAPVTAKRVRIIQPHRHGAYAGRSFFGRAPIDPFHTRLTYPSSVAFVSGPQVLYDVGVVRLFAAGYGRFVLGLPRLGTDLGAVAWSGPNELRAELPLSTPLTASTGDPRASYFSRVLTGNRPFATHTRTLAARATYRTIALSTDRLRAAGVRWSAFLDPTL